MSAVRDAVPGGTGSYPAATVAAARAKVAADAAAFLAMAVVLPGDRRPAVEAGYFANALVALDARFGDRRRDIEGHDGNPLNEVRLLAAALLRDRPLTADPAIRYRPEHSVLGLAVGQPVLLSADPFRALAEAFLQEIEGKYLP